MAWRSPRADKAQAHRLTEHNAREWEAELGRSLTADELRQVHAASSRTAKSWGDTFRKKAGR